MIDAVANIARPLILFDGVCHLCNGFVQFVLEQDAAGVFDFAPLQSEKAMTLLGRQHLDSMVLVEGDRVYQAEAGVLRVLSRLRTPWPLVSKVLSWVPKPLLCWGYRTVARFRYRIFGRKEVCALPRPEWKGRFLG